MNGGGLAALLQIVAGAPGLAYGAFTSTNDARETKFGAIEQTVKGEETVNIPVWPGAGILIAGVLLLARVRKSGA